MEDKIYNDTMPASFLVHATSKQKEEVDVHKLATGHQNFIWGD